MTEVIIFLVVAAITVFVVLFGLRLARMEEDAAARAGTWFGLGALALLALGLVLGLFVAPAERLMGDVYRIMYVHFPSWAGTAAGYLVAFIASIAYLRTRNLGYDYVAAAAAEIGLLFNFTGLVTGALWGRPTWGVYWTWDPRLTTTAIMAITFAGYLVLRAFLEDPESRARIAALVAIIGFVNLPIVYFSVNWWRTLHQVQSSPETVDAPIAWALRTMMLAFVLVFLFVLTRRFMLARLLGAEELRNLQLEVSGD